MFNHIYEKSFDIKTKLEIQYIKSFWKLYIPIWYSFLYLHQCTRSTIFPLCMHNISWVGQWHYFAHLWPLVCVVPFICTLHDQQFLLSPLQERKLWIQYLSFWSIVSHFNFWMQTLKKEFLTTRSFHRICLIQICPWANTSYNTMLLNR